MKYSFTTADVSAIVQELKQKLIGLRVNQIYDIDHKTYLIKLQKPEHKTVLLLESAARIHTTEYEWPKSPAPSSFSMKLRKHLRNKRLESIEQLGVDRVVDLVFGSGDVAYHLIVELYDRGNIVLTDNEYLILNVLRPRIEGEDARIAVNQKYPLDSMRTAREPPSIEVLKTFLAEAKSGTPLKKILNPLLDCGGNVLEHELLNAGFPTGAKVGRDIEHTGDLSNLQEAASRAQLSLQQKFKDTDFKGYIIKKGEERKKADGTSETIFLYQEFHFKLFLQHDSLAYEEFSSFNLACDEFFSKLESNQLDKKTLQIEREALKKLDNVKRDHEKRLKDLQERQEVDRQKGQLIELNKDVVEGAMMVIRSAIANQINWEHIHELIEEAQARNDIIANSIRNLKLEKNMMTLWLCDPYDCDENDMFLDSDEEREEGTESDKMRPTAVDIDLDVSALANARNYYNLKRQAALKEQKTIDASFKAIKSAERKTQITLKEISAIAIINKARKVHWFEKFYWFISSENYLVLGGRDSQQNELIVKRHLRPTDIYVHADLHGASSIIIKNPKGGEVPPTTLNEAGTMALCYSKAWEEKVVTSAWWVWGNQVSKTAPTGEYLTTGAFMVRGKKNFLPPSYHIYGFGFVFRLEESSVSRHLGERKVRVHDETMNSAMSMLLESLSLASEETEIVLDDDDDDDDEAGEETCDNQEIKPLNESTAILQVIIEETKVADINQIKKNDSMSADDEDSILHDDQDEKLTNLTEEISEFPDTVLEMIHLKEGQFAMIAKSPDQSENSNQSDKKRRHDSVSSTGTSKSDKARNKQSTLKSLDDTTEAPVSKQDGKPGPPPVLKRRQKAKLKKMLKYKDQDDEEREMRMRILQCPGVVKPLKGRAAKRALQEIKQQKILASQKARENRPPPIKPKPEETNEEQEDDLEEEEAIQMADDIAVVDSLTAVPVAEDELLYAVPVCAPYIAMKNFKYKVKLIPGTGKKGKACKTALRLFLSDKSTPAREKDLLRAVKDYDLAKNLPGKVKVSAPNISKKKK